jgi:ABC-type transport system involved in multi-copper enzyme maturation permease subunit
MIATVVQQELLIGSRRNRLRVLRYLYAGLLIGQVLYLGGKCLFFEQQKRFSAQIAAMMANSVPPDPTPISVPDVVGAWFAEMFINQQFGLLAIATPALVAGAITDEKRRGTLQYLLLADLSMRELLLGKLFGRAAQVGLLVITGLPLFALMAGFGGVAPLTVLVFLAHSAVTVLAAAAIGLLASVWCRQTRDAVLALYAVGLAGGFLVWRAGGPLDAFNPLWVMDSAELIGAEELARRFALAALCWGTLGGVCLAVAVWRLKAVYLREMEGSGPKKVTWYSGRRPALDDDPIRWRERNVEGLSPLAGLRRVPQWLAVTLLALLTTATSSLILWFSLAPGASPRDVFEALRHLDFVAVEQLLPDATNGFLAQGVGILLLASLVVGIRCSGAVTGERERQTWEALLLSPLSPRELIRGKLWGIMGASYIYLVACGLPALLLSTIAGPLALFWTVLWLAVTVLAMYFMGAAGLYSSVGAKSSWQALLHTLGWGYLSAIIANGIVSVILYATLFICVMMLLEIDARLQTGLLGIFLKNLSRTVQLYLFALWLSLAISLWILARLFLNWAQNHIAKRERTRHWRSAPIYRKSKRRPMRRVAT